MPDLLAPFHQEFAQLALAELALLAIAAAGVGCWIVLYGLSYAAESLSHAILPGLVAATLLGLPLLLGGAVGALVAAAAIAAAGALRRIDRDVGTAAVVTTAFGAGVLLALAPSTPRGLGGLLFGDALAVAPQDLAVTALVVTVTVAVLALLHRRLLAVGFDRGTAAMIGARPRVTELALLACIAAGVIVGAQALGTLLVVAILVRRRPRRGSSRTGCPRCSRWRWPSRSWPGSPGSSSRITPAPPPARRSRSACRRLPGGRGARPPRSRGRRRVAPRRAPRPGSRGAPPPGRSRPRVPGPRTA